MNTRTSSDYEAEADRVQKQIDKTVRELRSRLTVSNLASEAAAGVGLDQDGLVGAIERTVKRYPVPAAVVGVGVGLWALVTVRNRSKRTDVAELALPLRQSSDSLIDSATQVFRDRAALKRRELVRSAQAKIAVGAEKVADELERKLDDVVHSIPGGSDVRPLMASAIQIALTAGLEGLLQRIGPGRVAQQATHDPRP